MKKIFGSFLLVFGFPFKLLKKTRVDNFVGGLVFGALFSLLVNLITIQVQEVIQKQRILEAIENEILSNALLASGKAEQNKKEIENNTPYNSFYFIKRYSRDLWEQSSEPLQYIAQLDPDTQTTLISYYSLIIPFYNGVLTNIEKITFEKLKNCSPIEGDVYLNESDLCLQWNKIMLDSEQSIALDVSEKSLDVLKKFHPTKDRLDSWFLKLAMGDKSTRILSGE